MKKIHLSHLAILSATCALSLLTLDSSIAQQPAATASQLPPVVVNPPAPRRRAAVAPVRTPRAAR
ncbi:hypothetical protein, partial [Tardiphaga sp.]|uniref:hypothetical protein n=1 Tax=Tardiphaga sp. TaxID=1926292 RepID=UPI0026139CDC